MRLFSHQGAHLSHSRHLISLKAVWLVTLLILLALSMFAQFGIGKAVHAAQSSFTFTAAGDYAQTNYTTANLNSIAQSGASFHLALGDLNYDPTHVTAEQWSTYVKSHLPDNFPFEILAGNEDKAQLDALAASLPDHLGNLSGIYAKEYSFDYPPQAPLARFILASPGDILSGYTYSKGSAHYNWVAQQIDGARSVGIPWVIVGLHEYCLVINSPLHSAPCAALDLTNLLLSKKVDLVLYGHKHNFQVSKQLALNSTTCPSLTVGAYNSGCVVSASTQLTKGAGSVMVITGTGGQTPLGDIDTTDPEIGYFRNWEGANLNPSWGVSQFSVSASQIRMQFVAAPGGSFTESFTITGNGAAVPSSSPAGTPPTGTGPLSRTWYFAEGRVGKGFREYLTLANPTARPCWVTIQYLYTLDGRSTPDKKTVSVNVPAASRLTQAVNRDLGLADSSTWAASLAAIVQVGTATTPDCPGIVAERPMYFSNFHGISSGTDVVGATRLSTAAFFADVPTGSNYTSYLSILNPSPTTANVMATYYANGSQVQSQTLAVAGQSRGTISPGLLRMPQHVAAVVRSDQPILVERPTYFVNVSAVSGAYNVVGVSQAASDWLFAEGYTGPGYQEFLTLANLDPSKTASVTITLKSATGATHATTLSLGPQSQSIWNVNRANTFPGATPEVSTEVTSASSGASIVVQRELYFTYKHTLPQAAMGGTDVMGQLGPALHGAYSFAEGYTNTGYNEWLTLQNPTSKDETVVLTLLNGNGKTSTHALSVHANSRFTLDVTILVQQVFNAGTNSAGNALSMVVQTLDGSAFVAERPMYWNTRTVSPFGTMGGSDIIGFVGA